MVASRREAERMLVEKKIVDETLALKNQ